MDFLFILTHVNLSILYEIISLLNYVYIETLTLCNLCSIGLENKVIIYISEDLQKCEEYSHFYK